MAISIFYRKKYFWKFLIFKHVADRKLSNFYAKHSFQKLSEMPLSEILEKRRLNLQHIPCLYYLKHAFEIEIILQ